MKFGYTIVYVSSVTSTLSFYKKAFGFETRFLHESEQYGELSTGETVLAFASHAMGEMNIVKGYQKTNSGALPLGIELAFVTENVLAAYSKAISAGATSISEPCEKPWGQTVAYVRDIDGVIVELLFANVTKANKSLKHRAFGTGQFLSRGFVVLLRKSIPQNRNLKTAA